jgi:hypothetical protein
MKTSKADRSDRNRKAIAGVQKHYASTQAIILDGVSYTPANIEKALQGSIDAADATTAAGAVFHKAVADEKSANVMADTVYRGLVAFVTGQFKTSPNTLADFGIVPLTRQTPAAATVASAVVKRAATRAARHTMGKRQKASIKGTVSSTAPATPPAAATPSVTAGATATAPSRPQQ